MYGNWISQPELFWKGFNVFLIPLAAWSLAWKGWALWRAAKQDSKPWFIALLLINTMGILEILYIFVFGKEKKSRKK
jgi:hypothetical protein